MSSGLVLEFSKMHGAGNDFIVVDNRFFRLSEAELTDIATRFCPRRFGIGADGLLALDIATSESIDYVMRYFNADGSQGEMCGNGARCLAAFARQGDIHSQPLRFLAADGTEYRAWVAPNASGPVRIELPASSSVSLSHASIPVGGGSSLDLDFVVTGVPHAVCFRTHLDDIPVEDWGPIVRHHSVFHPSAGANVDFVEVEDDGPEPVLRMRTFERGVEAETLACGTGAVSVFVAARASGRIRSREAIVKALGGDLRVGYLEDANLFLEGPVAFVYRGTITV